MKTKIKGVLVIMLFLAIAVLPVAETMKVNRITAWENLEYTNVQNEILGLLLDNSWQLKYNYPLNILSDGAIWTTLDDCGDIQQNVNHYYAGDNVYVNGANFDPDTGYNWNIKGAPCSCDPNIVVANGIVYTDSDGNFCFNAYTIQSDDCGVYHVNVGNKNDNYQVVTPENDPPVIYNPNPANSATNVPVTISELSVTIEDPEGDTIDWTIETSPNIGSNSATGENNGTKTCSISGLEYETTYTWYVNATDPYGSGNTTVVFYTFTTISNDPPVISNPNPSNGATDVSVSISELSVTIEDPEGDLIDWSITTSPDIGSSSGTGENNGTKTCSISGLEYETTYTWYVSATDPNDSGETTEKTYTFTTMTSTPPVISNPEPPNNAIDIAITLSEISVTIEDPEGDTIDWTIETSPNIGINSGTGETNGTKTCSVSGLEYNTIYTWYVNATDPSGSGETTEEVYTFTTKSNLPPVIFNPDPEDGISGVSIYVGELIVTIEDPEGDTFDWTIETSPDIGSNSGTGDSNGTKTCDVYCGLDYNTTFTWFVNATDPDGSGETSEEVYTFTTELEGNNPPVISNPDPPDSNTDVSVSLSELSVLIEDPEGDTFDWSFETSPDIGSSSGTGEGNGTKICSVSGLEYGTTYHWYVDVIDPDGSGKTRRRSCVFTTELGPPSIPDGPMFLDIGEIGEYCTSTILTDGNQVQYRFDWDAEGSHDYSVWSDFVSSGTEVCVDHSWSIRGTYVVKAQARDEFDSTSDWSDGLTVMVGNHPPNAPVIDGPNSGKTGNSYPYTFTSTDPNGDQVWKHNRLDCFPSFWSSRVQ
jgi:hypothetical protein